VGQGAGGIPAAAAGGGHYLGADPARIDVAADVGDDPADPVAKHHREGHGGTLRGAGPDLGVDEGDRRDGDCYGHLSGSRVGIRQLDGVQDLGRPGVVGDYGTHAPGSHVSADSAASFIP